MLIIHDKREAPRGDRPAPPPGDLFHQRKATDMQQSASIPMIALVGFSPGAGVIPRWSRFTERASRVKHRLDHRQAMEDVTVIAGVTIEHAKIIARAGVFTLEALADLAEEVLSGLALDAAAIEAIAEWRAARREEIAKAEAEEEGLIDIPGVGPATAAKLADAGIDDFSKLLAAPDEALEALELSAAALDALRTYRAEQAES